jgi:hypothetical protein
MHVDEPRSGRRNEAVCYPISEDQRRLIGKEVLQSKWLHTLLRGLIWVGVRCEPPDQVFRNDPIHAEQSGQEEALPEQLPAGHIATPISSRDPASGPPLDALEIALEGRRMELARLPIENHDVGDLRSHRLALL